MALMERSLPLLRRDFGFFDDFYTRRGLRDTYWDHWWDHPRRHHTVIHTRPALRTHTTHHYVTSSSDGSSRLDSRPTVHIPTVTHVDTRMDRQMAETRREMDRQMDKARMDMHMDGARREADRQLESTQSMMNMEMDSTVSKLKTDLDMETSKIRNNMFQLVPKSVFDTDINRGLITETQHPIIESQGRRQLSLNFNVSNFHPEEITCKVVGDNILQVHAKHEEKGPGGSKSAEFMRQYKLPKGVNVNDLRPHLARDGILTIEAPAEHLGPTERRLSIMY